MPNAAKVMQTTPGKNKWVYSFGREICEGDASQKNLLGGKGANLAEMSKIGLPVPPGFVLSTGRATWRNFGSDTAMPPPIGWKPIFAPRNTAP